MDYYLESGEKVDLHEELVSGGYLVERVYIYNDYDTGEYERGSGQIIKVDKLFKGEPKSVYHELIKQEEARLDDLRLSKKHIQEDVSKHKADLAEIEDKIKMIPALKHIIDFINGDFEFFAYPGDYRGPKVLTKNEGLEDGESYSRDTRLLSLFGDSKGNLQWMLNRYRDGSGSWDIAIPCRTKEECNDAIADFILKECAEKVKNEQLYMLDSKIEWLTGNGYSVNQEWVLLAKASAEESRIKNIASTLRDRKRYDDKLKELGYDGDAK